jgi:hypothetical protein
VALHEGGWPKNGINCVNGDRSDTRSANLREITRAQQQASTPVRSFLGVKGVWVTRYGKYAAEIRGAGQKTYLGCFATLEEANAAYAKAAKKAFGSFAKTR